MESRDVGRAGLHPRRPPLAPDRGLAAGVLGEADAGAVEPGFAEAHPGAGVAAGTATTCAPRRQPPASEVAAGHPGAGRGRVLDRDRQRPQRRPGALRRASTTWLSARAQSSRSSKAGTGDGNPLAELARRAVGGRRREEGVEAAAPVDRTEPLLHAVVEGVPPGPAHRGDAGARRRRPAPAGETRAGDRPLAVAGQALRRARRRTGRRRRARSRRRGGTWRRRWCRPSRRRHRRTSRTAPPRTCRPPPSRPPATSRSAPAGCPARRPAPRPSLDPTIGSSLARLRSGGPRNAAGQTLPPPVARRPGSGLCENRANVSSHQRSDNREAARRHRPRAAALDRRAGHGPLDRGQGGRPGRGRRLADHRRLPDPLPLRTGRRPAGLPAGRRDRGRGRLRRPLRRGERQPPADARPQQAAAGRAGQGQERDLRLLRQGRGRQVDDDRQPGRGADRRRPLRRRARLRRLRLLDPAHARRQPQTGGQRRAQDPAAGLRRAG